MSVEIEAHAGIVRHAQGNEELVVDGRATAFVFRDGAVIEEERVEGELALAAGAIVDVDPAIAEVGRDAFVVALGDDVGGAIKIGAGEAEILETQKTARRIHGVGQAFGPVEALLKQRFGRGDLHTVLPCMIRQGDRGRDKHRAIAKASAIQRAVG